MRSVFRLGRGHHYLVARIVIDVDSSSPEPRPVLTEKLSDPCVSKFSNLLCHVRSRYTYDMVPLYPEISFATGAITSHEVEAEPKSVPLTWPISRVKKKCHLIFDLANETAHP